MSGESGEPADIAQPPSSESHIRITELILPLVPSNAFPDVSFHV